jgi:hypothetical protein
MQKKIEYLLTPWDTKSLGFNTAEININGYTEFQNFKEDYSIFENELVKCNVKFIYTRVSNLDKHLRNFLQKAGFYFVETSIELNLNKLSNFERRKLPKIEYKIAAKDDLAFIKNIARDSFNFGRFHEDVNISITKSRLRYFNWIDDLVKQNAEIYVAKIGGSIIGFNIQKSDYSKKTTTLVLAGCKQGAEIFSMSLWNEIIDENKTKGINQISALISASNIGVFNLYLNFNFIVKNTYFGFHKIII